MARKNIFQKLSSNVNYYDEINRIEQLLKNKTGIRIEVAPKNWGLEPDFHSLSIESFVDTFVFKSWKQRGTCISCEDMRESLGFDFIFDAKESELELNEILNYFEYASNILNLVTYVKLKSNACYSETDIYKAAEKNIRSCLNWLNHEIKTFDKQQKVLVVEKNPSATAVAEIVEEDIAYRIMKYNHYILKGDIEAKKEILLTLGNELEPRRKELNSINKQLTDDVFFLLNNLNIRHNNRSKKDKNYKEYVAKMKKDKLKSWYDELYQMILLCFLLLDNRNRTTEIKDLKDKITGVI